MLDHEFRQALNDEIHGRPGLTVTAPARITHLAFTLTKEDNDPLLQVTKLCDAFGVKPPVEGARHHSAELASGLFKYERHGEFYRISVTAQNTRKSRKQFRFCRWAGLMNCRASGWLPSTRKSCPAT